MAAQLKAPILPPSIVSCGLSPCKDHHLALTIGRSIGIHSCGNKYLVYRKRDTLGFQKGYDYLLRSHSSSKRREHMKGSWLLKSGLHIIASSIEGDQVQNGSNSNVEEQPIKQYVWPNGKKPRICILGGGFGGLYTALRLESLVWPADKKPQVLIVDQSDRFVFKPMMYELLSKEVDVWEVAPLFKDLLASTSIMFEKDRVKTILPCDGLRRPDLVASTKKDVGGKVLLKSGLEIEYDWLVLALGAESRRDIVPGAAEYALPFSSLEDVLEVDKQLKNLQQEKFGCEKCPIQIVVVGAGYCGVELAATLAERLGDKGKVQVIDATPDICSSAPVGNREVASKSWSLEENRRAS